MSPYLAVIPSPVGHLGLKFRGEKLISLQMTSHSLQESSDPRVKRVKAELKQYFANPQHQCDFDTLIEGTPFQEKVWRAIQQIPAGKTLSYGELAKKLATGPRAIGASCRTNAVLLFIPCHRVVGANDLGGYAGAREGEGIEIKKWLLKHEGAI